MNVLFYQDSVGVSGAEIYTADAAQKLREFGHNVSLACPSRSWMEQQARHKGFAYTDFSFEDGTDDHLHWLLTDHLVRHEIDVILCGTPGKRPEVPRVDAAIRAAGSGRILIRIGVSPGSERAFEPARLGIGFDTVDGIIAVSAEVRSNLLHFYPQLDPDRVYCLYNGVDCNRYAPDRHTDAEVRGLRRQMEIPDHHSVVAAIGRLDAIKNLPLLIRSAREVLKKQPNTTFLIAGEGAQRESLETLAREEGIASNIRFIGHVEDIPLLLSAVDIVCHASLSEGVPNALLEAMAAGKAVIASDIGGIPEVVTHDSNGWLFPSGNERALTDALNYLLQNPGARQKLADSARRHVVANFDRVGNIKALEQRLLACLDDAARVPAPKGRQTYVPGDTFIASPVMVA